MKLPAWANPMSDLRTVIREQQNELRDLRSRLELLEQGPAPARLDRKEPGRTSGAEKPLQSIPTVGDAVPHGTGRPIEVFAIDGEGTVIGPLTLPLPEHRVIDESVVDSPPRLAER